MGSVIVWSWKSLLLGNLFANIAFTGPVEEKSYSSPATPHRVVACPSRVSIRSSQAIRHTAQGLPSVQKQSHILWFDRRYIQVLLQGRYIEGYSKVTFFEAEWWITVKYLSQNIANTPDDQWTSVLADYIRHHDEVLLKASEKIMSTYTDELLPCTCFGEFCDIVGKFI